MAGFPQDSHRFHLGYLSLLHITFGQYEGLLVYALVGQLVYQERWSRTWDSLFEHD